MLSIRLGGMTILAGLALFTTVSFALPGSTDKRVDLSEEERDWIVHHTPVRAGVNNSRQPFSYLGADGKVVGIDIDILQVISERTGLKFEIVPASSAEGVAALAEQGQLVLVTGAAWSPSREENLQFTRAYSRSQVVIVGREGDRRFAHISLIRHARIAMPRKTAALEALAKRLPFAELILTGMQGDCFELVAKGKADVTIANMFVTSQYLNAHPDAKLAICGVMSEFEFPLRLGVKRGDTLLLGILDKGLESISQDEMDEIFSKHLLIELQGARRVGLLHERIKLLLLAAAGVGALLLLWNFSMRKEIRARRVAEAELREANRSMEVFSHSLSHDLKGPLRAITGFAEMLKQGCREKLDADERGYLDRITTAASRMENLMRDVLTYNQISHSDSPLQAVPLNTLVRQLVDEFPLEKRGCFNIAAPLPDVRANPSLLGQCIANLLSNAVKFVPRDRTPAIRIQAEQDQSFVKLWVVDNGIGIAPEYHEKVFKLFERAAPDYEGTGVGLAVLAKAMERMGGSFGVESELGHGSRFWIRLPATERNGTRV